MSNISFRNSKIVYYGPYACENCGVAIVSMGKEWGGNSFNAPEGPVYPNTEWHPHVCDPKFVAQKKSVQARTYVLFRYNFAHAEKVGNLGYVIVDGNIADTQHQLVLSPCNQYCSSENEAWIAAHERQSKNLPTWMIALKS